MFCKSCKGILQCLYNGTPSLKHESLLNKDIGRYIILRCPKFNIIRVEIHKGTLEGKGTQAPQGKRYQGTSREKVPFRSPRISREKVPFWSPHISREKVPFWCPYTSRKKVLFRYPRTSREKVPFTVGVTKMRIPKPKLHQKCVCGFQWSHSCTKFVHHYRKLIRI